MVDKREKIFQMIPNIFKSFSVVPDEIRSYQGAHTISILHAGSVFQFVKYLIIETKIEILKRIN